LSRFLVSSILALSVICRRFVTLHSRFCYGCSSLLLSVYSPLCFSCTIKHLSLVLPSFYIYSLVLNVLSVRSLAVSSFLASELVVAVLIRICCELYHTYKPARCINSFLPNRRSLRHVSLFQCSFNCIVFALLFMLSFSLSCLLASTFFSCC